MSSVDKVTVGHASATGGEAAKTDMKTESTASAPKQHQTKTSSKGKARVIRNFTYELHDVEDIFTSKISFFLTELNKQLNALVNSNIYTENKENMDKVLKSKSDFRKELLRLLKTEYKDLYQKYYFEAKIFGNKAKYFRTVIEEYRRILLSRLSRQIVIDMIVNNPEITYQEVFNKLCELNDGSSDKDYKFNWISKAEFNNIIKQVSNSASEAKAASYTVVQQVINVYAIDYSIEDDQISEFNLTESEDKEYYLIEFKLKYSDYTTQSDSLLTYQCKIPKKQIKGLTTGYTKLEKFTRPRIFLRNLQGGGVASSSETSPLLASPPPPKLYISFNYELSNEWRNSKLAIESVNTWQFKTMGIDIGVAKSATAAIMTTNMCWAIVSDTASVANDMATVVVSDEIESKAMRSNSKASDGEAAPPSSGEDVKQVKPDKIVTIDITQPVAISNELTISDKTKSVSKHIEKLKEEQNYIYKKEKAIYDLLKLKALPSDDGKALVNNAGGGVTASPVMPSNNAAKLFHKYQSLNKHRLHLRSKTANLKKELSFLTARDMISHAIDNKVDLITLEKLSWIRDEHHTTWDYNQIQQRIIHEANIYGIKVKKVACAYSSSHNPLTLEKDEVDQNRKLVKCLFDRDYAAAIILARRGIKLGKKKLQQQSYNEQNSHINDSFKAVSCSIKPSLQYRQLKLCEQKSIICTSSKTEANFAYYSIL